MKKQLVFKLMKMFFDYPLIIHQNCVVRQCPLFNCEYTSDKPNILQ